MQTATKFDSDQSLYFLCLSTNFTGVVFFSVDFIWLNGFVAIPPFPACAHSIGTHAAANEI